MVRATREAVQIVDVPRKASKRRLCASEEIFLVLVAKRIFELHRKQQSKVWLRKKETKMQLESRAACQRQWRDLRSYQCQPHATPEAERELEDAWRKSVEEDGCRLLN